MLLDWTVISPDTEMSRVSPCRPTHSVLPLTVLMLTLPSMSLRVRDPETVLVVTPRRSPLTTADAPTVLTLTLASEGIETLTVARLRPKFSMSALEGVQHGLVALLAVHHLEGPPVPADLQRQAFDLGHLDPGGGRVLVGDDVDVSTDQPDDQ